MPIKSNNFLIFRYVFCVVPISPMMEYGFADIVFPAEAVKYVNDVALSSKNVKTESLLESRRLRSD